MKCNLRQVRLNRDGYDNRGAYWGCDYLRLWVATPEDGSGTVYVRASTREIAARKVREEWPGAVFKGLPPPGASPSLPRPGGG